MAFRQFSVNINIFIPLERQLSIYCQRENFATVSSKNKRTREVKSKGLSFLFIRVWNSRTWCFGCYVVCVSGARGGYTWEFLVEVCRSVLRILTLFQTKQRHFPHPFSDQTSKIHTRFQTWPLGRNYIIMAYIIAQTKNFFKCISNSHISTSFLFTWN